MADLYGGTDLLPVRLSRRMGYPVELHQCVMTVNCKILGFKNNAYLSQKNYFILARILWIKSDLRSTFIAAVLHVIPAL